MLSTFLAFILGFGSCLFALHIGLRIANGYCKSLVDVVRGTGTESSNKRERFHVSDEFMETFQKNGRATELVYGNRPRK